MVRTFRAKPNTRAVVEPQPALLGLFCWNLQPLSLPQTLDALVVYVPAGMTKKSCDTAITVSAILPCQLGHISNKALFVFSASWHPALRRAMLTKHTTGPTLRDAKLITHPVNAPPPTRGA